MFMMSFQQNIGFSGYNPFMFGCYNPRLNFFLGMAAQTAYTQPYIPMFTTIHITTPMPVCNYPVFNSYKAMNYNTPYTISGIGSFNYQTPQTFTYISQEASQNSYQFTYTNPISVSSTTPTTSAKSEPETSTSKPSKTQGDSGNALSKLGNSRIMKNVPKERKKQILAAVDEACKKYNVDPKLVISMMFCESGFNPQATSHCGAAGLMQLMPGTAKTYGASNVYDIRENIFAGVKFISYLNKRYNGNRDLVVAAYNAGPGRVKNQVPNIKETKNYVAKVNQTYSSLA